MQKEPSPVLHPDFIDHDANQILSRLQKSGFTSYLVGGCVRDLLIGIIPKDFDIATEARPGQVKKAVPYSYIIGKRFRLVLVRRGPKQFEVATFRRNMTDEEYHAEDQSSGDNFFGTPEEDALRRDFTINSMLYDPSKDELIDYSGGLKDIQAGMIRMIGEPDKRIEEDPIRILRALRLAHKIRFRIEPSLRESMQKNAHLLVDAVLPRKREEYLKLLRLSNPSQAFLEAYDMQLLHEMLPALVPVFDDIEKRTTFLTYLRQISSLPLDKSNPVDLFSHFILSYVRAEISDANVDSSKKSLLENQNLDRLMREQLGMFKSEQNLVLRALATEGLLIQVERFSRRGQRRKNAFIANEAFPIALKMARVDCVLSCEQYHYWHSQYWNALPLEPSKKVPSKSSNQRRRN